MPATTDGYSSLASFAPLAATVNDDYGDTRATAAVLPVGGSVTGAIGAPNDHDMFKVHLEAGRLYSGALSDATGLAAGQLKVALYDSAGKAVSMYAIVVSGGGAKPYTLSGAVQATGDYYLDVSSAQAAGGYRLSLSEAQDDIGSAPGNSGTLAIGGQASGTVNQQYDDDWFLVHLDAGQAYTFSLGAGDTSRLLALVSPESGMRSYNPGGTYIADATGDFYVSVGGGVGAYTVRAAALPDDTGRTADTAGSITAGQGTHAVFDYIADRDAFLMPVEAGRLYQAVLTTDNGNTTLTTLSVQESGSAAIAPITDGFSQVPATIKNFKALADGVVMVSAESFNKAPAGYNILVTQYGIDDHGDSEARATPLPLDTTINGKIEHRTDYDVFKLHLDAGVSYRISGGGSLAPGGQQSSQLLLSTSQAGPHTPASAGFLNLTPAAGGDYYVYAYSPYQTGGYTLLATVGADVTAPQVLAGAAAADASLDGTIRVYFNEAIQRAAPAVGADYLNILDSKGKLVGDLGTDPQAVKLHYTDNALTMKVSQALMPGELYRVTIPVSYAADFAGNPLAAAFTVTVQAPPGAIAPGGGDGIYAAAADGRVIDGGAGFDKAVYRGYASDYTAKATAAGFTVTPKAAGAKSDTLAGIERVFFTQGSDVLALDVDGVAGRAYRLYQSAFDRAPDKPGAGFWIGALEHGITLQQVAQGFIASDEFKALYGANPSDTDFVTRLYQNVLHRAGEPGGMEFWTGMLQLGVQRADVLAAFSESPENVAGVAPLIANGFLYTPYG